MLYVALLPYEMRHRMQEEYGCRHVHWDSAYSVY